MFLKKHFGPKAQTDLAADILENIERILSTKKGYGGFQKNLGIGDFIGSNNRAEATEILIQDISQSLTEGEPRLQLIEIKEEKTTIQNKLSLSIQCQIAGKNTKIKVVADPISNTLKLELV